MEQHDSKILERVRIHERYLMRSISWISLGIAILYVCGYTWRYYYYNRMGIPVSMIDFPFPEILVPKIRLFVFIAQALFVIAYEKYSEFFIKSKRLYRAKEIGVDAPINKLNDYALRPNSDSPDKINFKILIEFLSKYISTNSKDNPQWQFERVKFDNKALELFQDIPLELKNSFITYSLKILIMDKAELDQTIKDSIGFPPEGSKIYEWIQKALRWIIVPFYIAALIFISLYVVVTAIYMALGILVGYFLVKVSKVEARWQMWHSALITVIVILALNAIDGHVTAGIELKTGQLPIVKIIKTDGDEQIGMLLGSFNDGYIVTASEPNDLFKHIKIHKQAVETISWTKVDSVIKESEKINKELKHLNNPKD